MTLVALEEHEIVFGWIEVRSRDGAAGADVLIETKRDGATDTDVSVRTTRKVTITRTIRWTEVIIVLVVIAVKGGLFAFCAKHVRLSPSVEALMDDHRNDVISNGVGMVLAKLGARFWAGLDPLGAILVTLYIMHVWFGSALEQVREVEPRSSFRLRLIATARRVHGAPPPPVSHGVVRPVRTTTIISGALLSCVQSSTSSLRLVSDTNSLTSVLSRPIGIPRHSSFTTPSIESLPPVASSSPSLRAQVRAMNGGRASDALIAQLTYMARNHHPKILFVDTVRAVHLGGDGAHAEVDIVLPRELPLAEAHDIGESLQIMLERIDGVFRAFVHLDYEFEHNPVKEHR